MDELIIQPETLNPYAKTFFGLWGLVVLALVGFRPGDLTYPPAPLPHTRPAQVHPNKIGWPYLSERVKNGVEITKNVNGER